MKKLLLVTGIFLFALVAKAQNTGDIGLNLYGGYTFDDKISSNSVSVEVNGAFQYGIGAEYYIRPSKSIELKYLRMDTNTPVFAPNPISISQVNSGNDSTAINYILIGGNNYFPTSNPNVKPFLGLDLGVGWASGDQSSDVRFAWDFKAGVKIKTSETISVKLQGYFQTIWGTYGSDYYRAPYPPYPVYSYPSDASLYQFGLGAAFEFDFKH